MNQTYFKCCSGFCYYCATVNVISNTTCIVYCNNCQEGPHSALNEEEFYDAIETALDRQDEAEATTVGVFDELQ